MLQECSLKNPIEFITPIDGDILNEFDGEVKDENLEIKVLLLAPKDSNIKVNGILANPTYNLLPEMLKSLDSEKILYQAIINLSPYKNKIEVVEQNYGYSQDIIVYWLKNATNKYRLSLDDNIWFLRDIARSNYKSIFENPYLNIYKEIHETYGTKVHINLFYQTDDFNLSQMPNKYKSEWKDNSDWLKLSFHSLQEFPDKPYIHTTYNYIKREYELVTNEIIRFAGEELLSPITTVHWGEITSDGVRALRSKGIRGLLGSFLIDNKGVPNISYYLNKEQTQHASKRDFWKDNKEDIIFIKFDICLDKTNLNCIRPFLNNLKRDKHQSGFIEMVVHEQYFYPYYFNYQPEYREKIMTSIRWAAENGYEPTFLSDILNSIF